MKLPVCHKCGARHQLADQKFCTHCGFKQILPAPAAASETTRFAEVIEASEALLSVVIDTYGEDDPLLFGDQIKRLAAVLDGLTAEDRETVAALRERLERLTEAAEAALGYFQRLAKDNDQEFDEMRHWYYPRDSSRGERVYPAALLRAALDTKGPTDA